MRLLDFEDKRDMFLRDELKANSNFCLQDVFLVYGRQAAKDKQDVLCIHFLGEWMFTVIKPELASLERNSAMRRWARIREELSKWWV